MSAPNTYEVVILNKALIILTHIRTHGYDLNVTLVRCDSGREALCTKYPVGRR